jgi:hypothetical protein
LLVSESNVQNLQRSWTEEVKWGQFVVTTRKEVSIAYSSHMVLSCIQEMASFKRS